MPENYAIHTVCSASPLDLEAIFRAAERGNKTERRMSELERLAICARIKQARQQAGLTQEELADLLHVRQRTIHNYETDRVPWRLVSQIAEATGVTSQWLLHGDEPTPADGARQADVAELRREVARQQAENAKAWQETQAMLAEIRSLLEQRRSA